MINKKKVISQSLMQSEIKRRIKEIKNQKKKLKRNKKIKISNKIKKKLFKLTHHLRLQKLHNQIKNNKKKNLVKLKKIGKMLILIHWLINSKEKMELHQPRKMTRRIMKIFSDNKFKMRKTSKTKPKVKKPKEVNKKLVIKKQRMREETFFPLKPPIKKKKRESRKEKMNYWQDKRRERQNYRRRKEGFK